MEWNVLVILLGIETSCDETAAGVVADGRELMSNVVESQVEMHSAHGGIVPEVASRQHVRQIVPVLERAIAEAGLDWPEIDAVSVTRGPGLAGSLIVGVNAAKGLAAALDRPLLGVNHLEGHIYAGWLMDAAGPAPGEEPGFPLMCLITSGGHTDLILMSGHDRYELIGRTRDDAAGEAFDKTARVLGLGFPGGPEIERVARHGGQGPRLPAARMPGSFDFSFSGLKTAVMRRAQAEGLHPAPPGGPDPDRVATLARAFQESVIDVLSGKAVEAAEMHGARGILLGGGVAANGPLREQLRERSPVPVLVPPPALCTDNGAMVAACGYFRLRTNGHSRWDMDVAPGLRLQ